MTDDAHAPTLAESSKRTSDVSTTSSPDARYRLRSLLGRGGMGEVWLAHDVRIDREIAIKMMRDGHENPDSVARFLREARVQGRLEHPAIVPVHDVGEADRPYFAMKRLTGITLAEVLLARANVDGDIARQWSRRTLLARLVDVCLAVELAHGRGVIHRDLKPANIMLGDFGESYVLDWGLARLVDTVDERAPAIRPSQEGGSGAGETVAGTTLGTPGYMPPEQMRGELVDARSDVFALGCILYEILSNGVPAIESSQAFEITLEAAHHRPRDRHPDADVPPELDELCARATAAEPSARLGSAREFADGIQRFLDGDRDLARRRELAAEQLAEGARWMEREHHEARAEAMRAGARALALDPANPAAQAFVGRLLLQPPTEPPPEVVTAIADERKRMGQTVFRFGSLVYGMFAIGALVILGITKTHAPPVVGLTGMLVLLCALTGYGSRDPDRAIRLFPVVFVLHALMFLGTGLTFGTLLFLPIVATGSISAGLMLPSVNVPKLIILGLLMTVVVSMALELTGVVPSTFRIVNDAIQIDLWAVDLPPQVIVGGTLGVFVLQLISSSMMCLSQRRAQERAVQRLHVHLWHFRQLVPMSKPA